MIPEPELKPCPFCGGEAKYIDASLGIICHVKCIKCGCRQSGTNMPNAIQNWNTRNVPEPKHVKN